MLKKIAAAGLATGGLLAALLTATSAMAAHSGRMVGAGIGAGVHAPGPSGNFGATAHAPRGVMNHPGPASGARVYGWQGGSRHFHHRRGFGVIVGNGYYDGDYDYGYAGGCEWLHHRAVVTGSRYWWRRYEDCVGG